MMEEVLRHFTEMANRLKEVSLRTERIEGQSRVQVKADPFVLRSRRRRGDAERSDDSDDWDLKPTIGFRSGMSHSPVLQARLLRELTTKKLSSKSYPEM